MIPAIRIVGWTIFGIIVTLWPSNALLKFIFSFSVIILTIFCTKNVKAGKYFIITTLPLIIPLVIIHGVINQQFPVTTTVLSIPYRHSGIIFAFAIYCNLMVILSIATAWTKMNKDDLFELLIFCHFPIVIIGIVAQAFAIATFIEKRGKAVYKAQTARGIRTGPGFIYHVRALPSVILPVVTSLLNEADHRSIALWSRGFLEYEFIPYDIYKVKLIDFIMIIVPFVAAISIHILIQLLK